MVYALYFLEFLGVYAFSCFRRFICLPYFSTLFSLRPFTTSGQWRWQQYNIFCNKNKPESYNTHCHTIFYFL